MPVYNLKKIDFDQLLSLINTNNPYLKIYGGFGVNKKNLYIKSITRLHNYNLEITKESEFDLIDKYRGKFCYYLKEQSLKTNELRSLIEVLESFSIKTQIKLTIEIRDGSFYANKLKYKAQELSAKSNTAQSKYSVVDYFINQNKSKLKPLPKELQRLNNECFSLIIKAESENEEAFQFLSSIRGEHNLVIKKGLFFAPRILMTRDEINSFINLNKFESEELHPIEKPILIGTSKNSNPIEISKNTLDNHLKIEGSTGMGKSGLMINILTNLINDNERILLFDPHNETAEKIFERVDSIENIQILSVKQNGLFMGTNPLICFLKSEKRAEHLEKLTYAFFSSEADKRQLATLESGRELLKAGIEFNFAYFGWLLKQGLNPEQASEIMKERQLTLNDLARIKNDEVLKNLLAEILRPKNPALARKMADFKQFNSQGVDASIIRFQESVNSVTGKAFFESRGFNVMQLLKENKSVFCLMNELSPLNRSIINKIIFSELFTTHKLKQIKHKTYFTVDESASAKVPNLMEIITEARKFSLHLILSYQGLEMWKDEESKTAIKLIPNLIEFDTDSKPKMKREFEAKTRDYQKPVSGFTVDYPNSKREFKTASKGLTYEQIEAKIKAKEFDARKYFLENIK